MKEHENYEEYAQTSDIKEKARARFKEEAHAKTREWIARERWDLLFEMREDVDWSYACEHVPFDVQWRMAVLGSFYNNYHSPQSMSDRWESSLLYFDMEDYVEKLPVQSYFYLAVAKCLERFILRREYFDFVHEIKKMDLECFQNEIRNMEALLKSAGSLSSYRPDNMFLEYLQGLELFQDTPETVRDMIYSSMRRILRNTDSSISIERAISSIRGSCRFLFGNSIDRGYEDMERQSNLMVDEMFRAIILYGSERKDFSFRWGMAGLKEMEDA